MPERNFSSPAYRYGFNGKEKDDELKGEGNSYDFGARMLDPRVGRWFAPDPKQKPFQTYYSFAANNPIIFIDPDGQDDYYFDTVTGSTIIIKNGAPNRYYIAMYEWSDVAPGASVGHVSGYMQHSIHSKEIKQIFTNNIPLYRQALAITSRDSEDYAKIYYAMDTVDEAAVIKVTLAIPLAFIAGAEILASEVAQTYLAEELIEYFIEETTGLPIIIDPVDLIEHSLKRGGKELVEEGIEKATKNADELTKTGGRLGNPSTREQNKAIADELEARGWEVTGGGGRLPEEYIPPIGGGRKGGSYPDITATKDGKTLRVNTVDTRKSGEMTTREATNADRIRTQKPNDHLLTVPKN